MERIPHSHQRIIAVLLFTIVTTQIIYFALSSSDANFNRMVLWSTEAVAFMGIAVFALASIGSSRTACLPWAAISVGGVLNTIQVGMGLAMFGPVSEAGEEMAPVFQSVIGGAFFLYFAGKFLFGFAAVVMGANLMRSGTPLRMVGALGAAVGLAAMAISLAAMAMGMTLAVPAGATGTVATLLLGIIALISARGPVRPSEGQLI